MKKLLSALLVLVLLTACGSKPAEGEKKTTYKIGIHGGDSGLAWKHVAEVLKEEDITLKIVSFAQYPEPNAALSNKDIDLNAFQHHAYFETEKKDFNYDLTAIADTYIAPMGAYSAAYDSLDKIQDGDTILIPNDVTNGGRAYDLLAANGLIELKNAEGEIPNSSDVVNSRNFKIIEMDAANIPSSLNEAGLAVINSGIAVDAGLDAKKAIFIEQVDLNNKEPFKQYINLIAVRTADKDDEVLKRIVEIYQTDEVKAIVDEDSKGANIPVW